MNIKKKGDVNMPTDKPRFSIVLEPEMSNELEAYWHNNRYKSKNAAINDLLRSAFDSIEKETNQTASLGISSEALDLARQYDRLSESARKLISMFVLFESADVDVKNTVFSLLVDHSNARLQSESPFAAASASALLAIEEQEEITPSAESK